MLQRQNINDQINSRFTPASDLKIGTFVLIPNFNTQKGISKKLQPLRKGPYQIIVKPTDVTYKIADSDQKEIVQHRNSLLPYYPKEYALRELTQLYSFTGLKVIQNHPHTENEIDEQNDIHLEKQNNKPPTTQNNTKKLGGRELCSAFFARQGRAPPARCIFQWVGVREQSYIAKCHILRNDLKTGPLKIAEFLHAARN